MAKSSRASTKKANNQRLKANVFGPIESARQERLSAKLLEIASQPKPVPEREMEDVEADKPETEEKAASEQKTDDSTRIILSITHLQPRRQTIYTWEVIDADHSLLVAMEIDTIKSSKPKKGKIVKRRGRKSNIVFPKFGDRKTIKKRK